MYHLFDMNSHLVIQIEGSRTSYYQVQKAIALIEGYDLIVLFQSSVK